MKVTQPDRTHDEASQESRLDETVLLSAKSSF